MSKARKSIVILISIAVLCSLFIVAFADASIDVGEIITTPTVDPYEYAKSPDELYAFIYYGTPPYLSLDIDTSECILDRLYVYDAVNNMVTEISEYPVSVYTCTQDALYYVTKEQKIYKTDYTSTYHEFLYQCTEGTIHNLGSYLDVLYFVEAQNHVVFLDTVTKDAQIIWTYDDLDWVFLLSTTQLVATTIEEDNYLYDIATKVATPISDVEANSMVTEAVQGATVADPDVSVLASFSTSSVTQENDIAFPLSEYPATIYDSSVSTFYRPLSWFHVNGAEGCSDTNCKWYGGTTECEGFARYAHDVYMHMVDTDVTYSAWDDNKHLSGTLRLDSDLDKIENFFSSLKTGAYIRYGKDTDSTPENGVHSVVFVSQDSGGIWVYECNQSYYSSLSAEEIGDHSSSYFGCGVHFQYYSFERLKKYHYVLHYVNHSFTESPVYESDIYHTRGCADCTGYVRQAHDDVDATFVSATQHNATFACCGDRTATTTHTGTVTYQSYNSLQHKVTATCCSGYILAKHIYVFNGSGSYVCTGCYADRDGFSDILSLEPLAQLYKA